MIEPSLQGLPDQPRTENPKFSGSHGSNRHGASPSEPSGAQMPPGFPSDFELTRVANEMFAQCDDFGPGPFGHLSNATNHSPDFVQTLRPQSVDVGRSQVAAPVHAFVKSTPVYPIASSTSSPFAFLDYSPNAPNTSQVTAHAPPQDPARDLTRARNTGVTPTTAAPSSFGSRGFTPSLSPVNLVQPSPGGFDANLVRKDFPILSEIVNGKPLVWLDNAATTQKPQAVIDRLSHFYQHENSNVHRAAHELARRSTDAFEAARESVARFINAPNLNTIVFVRGTTEAINLIAQSFGRRNLSEGDEIIITHLEHHANIVPWQQLCAEKKARLLVAPVDNRGQILLDEYRSLFSSKTRLVSMSHVSNALGTITPAREMIDVAHRLNVPVLLDGAQSVSHMRVDVQALDCDFFVFSGHKVFAPTGIGALYGKEKLLNDMPPWQGGGNMIQDVTFEKTIYHAAPMRFEAGTGNIADAVGMHAAIDYVQRIGLENISRYEHDLLAYGTNELSKIPNLRMIGTAVEKAGVLSFVVDGVSTESIGNALSNEGIAVRSGHHCAQPILRRFGLESTVRASLALYNTPADIDHLVRIVREASHQQL